MKAMIIGAIIVLAVIWGPLLIIWSLNTLFGLGIAYSIKTWFAALALGGALAGGSRA